MPKCAVVNNDGLVVNIIIADPSVDSLPESTLIECDDNVYIDCTWDGTSFNPSAEVLALQASVREAIEKEALED